MEGPLFFAFREGFRNVVERKCIGYTAYIPAMKRSFPYQSRASFTLVELLVVIGILAILTAAVVIILNPAELLKQSRDSKRTTDLANLNNAIKLLLTQSPDVNLGSASTVYISLSDSSSTCGSHSLPSLPSGWKYQCATSANYQKTDGGGWVPVNFGSTGGVASLPALPLDPQNSGAYYYGYIPGGGWELMGLFESEKYAAKARDDAGVDPERLEVGSNLALWKNPYGLIGYWPLDEGSGTAAADKSGSGNAGALTNGPAWQPGSSCKVGGCLSFDGIDDYVNCGSSGSLRSTAAVSVSFWAKVGAEKADQFFVSYGDTGFHGWNLILSGTSLYMRVGNGSLAAVPGISLSPLTGAWHHVVGVYDGSNAQVYIDGAYGTGSPFSGLIDYSGMTACYIGNAQGLSSVRYFNGYLDDIRVYNRALSAADVSAIYNATK